MLLTARSRAGSRTLEGAHKRRLKPATTEIASLAMTGFTEYLRSWFCWNFRAYKFSDCYHNIKKNVLSPMSKTKSKCNYSALSYFTAEHAESAKNKAFSSQRLANKRKNNHLSIFPRPRACANKRNLKVATTLPYFLDSSLRSLRWTVKTFFHWTLF